MSYLVSIFNRLLPFATPGTPVIQDLVHLAVIATLLYYAPQLQGRFNQPSNQETPHLADHDPIPAEPEQNAHVEHPVDRNPEHAEPEDPVNLQHQDLPAPPPPPREDEAGPANHPPHVPTHRNVGAKKAKSLAKKDQRRAYNEFMRSQGEAQRARDAAGAAEREAEQAAERERRRAAAAVVEAKKAKEREQRKELERSEREQEIARRDEVLSIVRRALEETGTINLFDVAGRMGGDADEVWVERILNAGGVLGWSTDGERLTVILSTGWVARISRRDMQRVYEKAASTSSGSKESEGRISLEKIGRLLEAVLKGDF